MVDKMVAATSKIMALKDQWLLKYNEIIPDLKARLKNFKQAEQKH